MAVLSSDLRGDPPVILVLRLPSAVVDETSIPIREEAASRLPNAAGAALVLDFADVDLVNSIGITCLLQLQDHCARAGAALRCAAMTPQIEAFFRRLKLDKRFPSTPTVEAAVAELQPL